MDWRVAGLALAVLAAGCVSDEAPVAQTDTTAPPAAAPANGPPAAGAAGLVPLAFADVEPLDVTRWENGTFTFSQHGRVRFLPPVAPQNNQIRFDITDRLPQGVPAVVEIQVSAQMGQGDVDIWIDAPDNEFRTGSWDTPRGGESRIRAVLVHASSEPVEVVLAYDEAEPAPEVPYTLSIRVSADPTLVPGGIPVAFELPAAATLEAELVGTRSDWAFEAQRASLMLFDPNDVFLGHFPLDAQTSLALGPDAPAGEYVAVLSQGARSLRLWTPTPSPLRAAGTEWVIGDMRAGTDATVASWTFETTRTPLLAGLLFRGSVVAGGLSASLTGPGGPLVSFETELGPFVNVGVGDERVLLDEWWIDTGFAIDTLASGTYQAEVRAEPGAGHEPVHATEILAYYTR